MVANLQGGPRCPLPPGVHTLVYSPPTLCVQDDSVEATLELPNLGHRRHYGLCQLSCHVVRTLRQPRERPTCKGTKVPRQQPAPACQPCERSILEADSPAPEMPSALADRAQESETPSQATPRFLTHRDQKISVYCFKPLSFGIIYYVVIDTTYRQMLL